MAFWLGLLSIILAACAALTGLWHLAGGRSGRVAPRAAGVGTGLPPAALSALGLGSVSAGALVFLLLARAWQAQPSLAMDAWAAMQARDAWSTTGHHVMLAVTMLGDPVTLSVLGAAVGLILLRRRRWALLVGWLVALVGNAVLNPALKMAYERLRPDPDLSDLVSSGYSFPSGHSSGAMVGYGMLAYLVWRLMPPRWCLPSLWLAAALILAIGASRVYLQAHFLSDVLAGFASGGAWLAACVAVSAAWHSGRCRPRN